MSDVTTWQALSDSAGEAPVFPTSDAFRPDAGVTRTMGGSETAPSTVQRVTASDLAPQGLGILGTAQNNCGSSTTKITADSTVEIPGGMRLSVKVAESLGYLQRTESGGYKNADQMPQQEQQKAAGEGDQGTGAEMFSPAIEAEYAAMIGPLPQPVYDSMLGAAVANLADGAALSAELSANLATTLGIEPAKAADMVKKGGDFWQAQADAKLSKMGVTPSEFYQWAWANREDQLKQAANQQITNRSTRGYDALVRDYFSSTVPSVEALEKAGIPHKTQGGETQVHLKGH